MILQFTACMDDEEQKWNEEQKWASEKILLHSEDILSARGIRGLDGSFVFTSKESMTNYTKLPPEFESEKPKSLIILRNGNHVYVSESIETIYSMPIIADEPGTDLASRQNRYLAIDDLLRKNQKD